MVLWQMQKFMCYCTVFAFFNTEFEDNFQVQAPRGLYLEGRFIGGFLCYEFGGLIFKGAYFWNFTVSGYVWKEPYSHDQMFIISGLLVSDTFAWSREVSLFSIS